VYERVAVRVPACTHRARIETNPEISRRGAEAAEELSASSAACVSLLFSIVEEEDEDRRRIATFSARGVSQG
jgi:hypothetical protein